jgi:hypothetical protein
MVISIDKSGKMAGPEETQKLLMSWFDRTWYSDATLMKKHQAMILSGHFLIVDGIFYPASCAQMTEYFPLIGANLKDSARFYPEMGNSPTIGISSTGDIAVKMKDGIYIYSQNGERLAIIGTDSIDPYKQVDQDNSDNHSDFFFSVNCNGDIYAMYVVKDDKAHFFTAVKTWGTDYIALAKAGISRNDSVKYAKLVAGLNNQEVRILKNAFFALQGYDFKSYDLRAYFNGFKWYKPSATAKAEPTLLSDAQKTLYAIVLEEENKRKK